METDLPTQARLADAIEAAAYCDMYAAAPLELAHALKLNSMELAGATLLIANGIPDPVFSRAIALGNSGVVSDAQIDAVIAAYAGADVGNYWVHVNPVVAQANLGVRLEQRGFQLAKRRTWAKMIRGTDPCTLDSALATRLATVGEQEIISQHIAAAFGMPPPFAQWIQVLTTRPKWTMVAAVDQGRIVGGGLLFIENQVAWLGMGAVVPEARGRHAHRAIMTQRIAIAIDRGCTHIVTETGEPINNEPNPSLRNMYRCGFTRVSSRLNYAATALKTVTRDA